MEVVVWLSRFSDLSISKLSIYIVINLGIQAQPINLNIIGIDKLNHNQEINQTTFK